MSAEPAASFHYLGRAERRPCVCQGHPFLDAGPAHIAHLWASSPIIWPADSARWVSVARPRSAQPLGGSHLDGRATECAPAARDAPASGRGPV